MSEEIIQLNDDVIKEESERSCK